MKNAFLKTAALLAFAPLGAMAQTPADSVQAGRSLASRFSVIVAGASKHLEQHYYRQGGTLHKFNEIAPGLDLQYHINSTFHADVGFYKNSLYVISKYALVGAETSKRFPVGAGIDAGAITGYYPHACAAARIYLRFGKADVTRKPQVGILSRFNLIVGLIPPLKGVTPGVITTQLRINLGGPKK